MPVSNETLRRKIGRLFNSPRFWIFGKIYRFQHDVKTALFLLPHVLLYVLLDGSQEDAEEVSMDQRYCCPFWYLDSH